MVGELFLYLPTLKVNIVATMFTRIANVHYRDIIPGLDVYFLHPVASRAAAGHHPGAVGQDAGDRAHTGCTALHLV
jgi:hypothetical protein